MICWTQTLVGIMGEAEAKNHRFKFRVVADKSCLMHFPLKLVWITSMLWMDKTLSLSRLLPKGICLVAVCRIIHLHPTFPRLTLAFSVPPLPVCPLVPVTAHLSSQFVILADLIQSMSEILLASCPLSTTLSELDEITVSVFLILLFFTLSL